MSSIVFQHDKRAGVTYAYSSESFYDPALKQSRSRRTLIGRVDEDGNIVPTSGKRKAFMEKQKDDSGEESAPTKTKKEPHPTVVNNELVKLKQQNKELKDEIKKLEKENQQLRTALEQVHSISAIITK
ncbi:MAG: hypothetical protein IKG34_10640 [Solobacterium sp.]|nr:hypothetical protein [Solobacterium sp.]MBR3178650.1 hypothetical protein [Clostridia bacterium]MBR3344641.1 hypothetical protein [Solobacterium sp.]